MKTRNYIALIVLLAMLLGLVAAVGLLSEAKRSFEDVSETHWAYPYIERAYHDGIVVGTKAEGEKRWFEPDAPLTVSAWTVILCHIFYPGEEEAYPEETWYSRQQAVLEKHGVFNGDTFDMNAPCTRYQMALLTYNIIKDKNIDGDIPNWILEETRRRIVDWDIIPSKYQMAVNVCVLLQIVAGVSENGKNIGFCGDRVLTRAQAATIYYNIAVHVFEYPAETPPDPTHGEVGTLSNKEVVLSIETHHWVNDYWSEQPPEIQKLLDQDRFNCLAQTIKDSPMMRTIVKRDDIWRDIALKNNTVNKYYNYACFGVDAGWPGPILQRLGLEEKQYGNTQYGYVYFFNPTTYIISSEKEKIFNEIISSAGNASSDYAIILACLKEFDRRFNYNVKADETVSWIDSGKNVNCGVCSDLMLEFLSYVGIPAFELTSGKLNHSWLEVRVDGEWMMVDASLSLISSLENGIQTKEKHAWNYTKDDISVDTSYEYDITLTEILLNYYPLRSDFNK